MALRRVLLGSPTLSFVMLGLVPSIYYGSSAATWVDPRDRPEDDGKGAPSGYKWPPAVLNSFPHSNFCHGQRGFTCFCSSDETSIVTEGGTLDAGCRF